MTFCERRWALVQIESIWADNRLTAEGNLLHEKAHSGQVELRPGVLIRRTLPVHSFRLGLSGQTDIVEFQPVRDGGTGMGIAGKSGLWRPYPVEYKRRRDKAGSIAYKVQLCAQAICLEEMLNTSIPEGAVFDGTAKRRQAVLFDASLRERTEAIAARMHELFAKGETPPPVFLKACASCSLIEQCQPEALATPGPVATYIRRVLGGMGA